MHSINHLALFDVLNITLHEEDFFSSYSKPPCVTIFFHRSSGGEERMAALAVAIQQFLQDQEVQRVAEQATDGPEGEDPGNLVFDSPDQQDG